jgi:hypothetical protein
LLSVGKKFSCTSSVLTSSQLWWILLVSLLRCSRTIFCCFQRVITDTSIANMWLSFLRACFDILFSHHKQLLAIWLFAFVLLS